MDGRIQQFTQAVQGCLAPGGHVDQFGNSHNGPDNGIEIADKFQKIAGIETAAVHQIAAVTQNDADNAFHKQGHQHTHQNRCLGVGHIGLLIFLVQLLESHQFLGFLDKGLDHRDAGKALLREVGQTGECLLTGIPLAHQRPAHHSGGSQQECHGDQ